MGAKNYGWQIRYVDDGNGVEQPVKGLTTGDRVASATEMVLAVDGADIAAVFTNSRNDPIDEHIKIGQKSWLMIILSNGEDMLSDCGSFLADLDLNPTDEQELANFVAQYHEPS